jgi:hypothetical protein
LSYFYYSYGLHICSEVQFKSLISISRKQDPDVVVKQFKTIATSSQSSDLEFFTFGKIPEGLFYSLKGIGRFVCSESLIIEVEQFNQDRDLMECILLEKALPFFLQNYGFHTFKGMAVLLNKKAHVFCGVPGIGLSTLAAKLSLSAYPIIADGWFQINFSEDKFFAKPANTKLKLWSDAMDSLQIESSELSRVREKLEKYYVTMPMVDANAVIEIESVYHLMIVGTGEFKMAISDLERGKRIEILSNFYNSNPKISELVNRERNFRNLIGLASNQGIKEFTRPKALWDIDLHETFILNHINE